MDLIKIGQFVDKKRKEKGLTQEQLGELLNISGKSVSKWERGLNMPDIDKLESLCNILDVDIVDMLNGEIDSNNSVKLSNLSFFDIFKLYKNKLKKNYFLILFFILFLVLIFFSVFFTLGNYDKNRVYSISSSDSSYSINGYLIFNQEQNLLVITDLNCQENFVGTAEEPYINEIHIFITYDDLNFLSYSEEFYEYEKLSDVMNRLSFSIFDNKSTDLNFLDYNVDLSKIKMTIEYKTKNELIQKIVFELNFIEIFANNKFLY